MKSKTSKILSFACIVSMLVSLCACEQRLDGGSITNPTIDVGGLITSVDTSINDKDVNSDYDEGSAQRISFSNEGVKVSGLGASASGTDLTITGSGTFVISGSCNDGSITVNASSNKVQIVLDNLDLTNKNGPALNVRNAKKITLTLKDGTRNVLSDADGYTLNEGGSAVDGAVFSKTNLVINGQGALTVNGNNAHGIVSKDDLTITGVILEVNSKLSGICGKDSLKMSDVDVTVNAGTDALKSDNETDADMGYIYIKGGTYKINSVNDAIQAFNTVVIEGGTFDITTTSTSSTLSAKAIKGGNGIHITAGEFEIHCEDDAIHSDNNVVIEGGSFNIASGDDGIHANETLNISNGNIVIEQSYEGIEASNIVIMGGYIDITSTDDGMNAAGGNDSNENVTGRPGGDMFDNGVGSIVISGGYIIMHNEGDGVDSNGTIDISGGIVLVDGPSHGGNGSLDYGKGANITGGIVIALGNSSMAQNFSEATQGSILVNSNGYFAAGTTLSLCDEKGNVVLAFTSTKQFTCALFSAPEIGKGKTYTFYTGASVSGLDENGYAHNSTQSGGTECGSVTVSDYISGQGQGMPGGPGGGYPSRPR